MTTDHLKQLLKSKTIIDFANEDQDFDHGLRLVLRDTETGELGLLAVEPWGDPFEGETKLDYSYQQLETLFGTPPVECLILDLKTRTEPDFAAGTTPTLFS
jgi:hypothetical protein